MLFNNLYFWLNYLDRTLINRSRLPKEIKNKLNFGHDRYHSLQNFFVFPPGITNVKNTTQETTYSNIYPTRCNITQFILSGNCSTVCGWYHHPSSGAQTTVSTASGICHTVIVICRYRGRVGTGLSVLGVAYATRRSPTTHSDRFQLFHDSCR
jgi:hypothetical protein